jgi:hypothetical protein
MIDFLIENKEFIAILSGIGTFLSALIAIFTLNEVKKQRLTLYKPEILIKSFAVSISKNPLHKEIDELILYKVADFNDYSINFNSIDFEVSPKYKVENLGFGIAKNVKCEWKFKTEKAISLIEKIMPDSYELKRHNNLNTFYLSNLNDEEFYYSTNANISRDNIDYISPINVQKHFHYHVIPEIIIFTHYLYFIFKSNLIEKTAENFNIFEFNNQLPKPTLVIEYKDLNGKKYKNEFNFNVTVVATQTNENLDLTNEFAYLEFELE